jgi:hypothetical protein
MLLRCAFGSSHRVLGWSPLLSYGPRLVFLSVMGRYMKNQFKLVRQTTSFPWNSLANSYFLFNAGLSPDHLACSGSVSLREGSFRGIGVSCVPYPDLSKPRTHMHLFNDNTMHSPVSCRLNKDKTTVYDIRLCLLKKNRLVALEINEFVLVLNFRYTAPVSSLSSLTEPSEKIRTMSCSYRTY